MEQPSQAAREELWIALADLFLDTETRWFLPDAAQVAVRHGFSWEQVSSILDYELTPVVGPNLLDVAGEWAGFDRGWLLPALRQAQAGGHGLGARIKAFSGRRANARLYDALRQLMEYLGGVPAADLPEESRRLRNLARLVLEPVWTSCSGFWSWVRELGLGSTPEQVQTSFHHGIAPVYGPLLVYDGDATVEQMQENWARLAELLQWISKQSVDRAELLEILAELSYLFTIEDLASVPRGPMVKAALVEGGVSPARAEELWRGPLSRLYPASPRAERNWYRLF